jgi:glycosyltransferase involved in cell wall biosynthesis
MVLADMDRIIVVVWAYERPERWRDCVQSASRLEGVDEIVFVTREPLVHPESVGWPDISYLCAPSLGEALVDIESREFDQILFIISPVVFSSNALARASSWIADDPRIATVSFLSNAAGYVSFPYWNTEVPVPPPGHDEETLTKKLRGKPDQGPVPIPVCEGAAVLVGRSAVVTSGRIQPGASAQYCLAEFSLRASRRGFNSYLDTGTFIFRPWDIIGHEPSVLTRPEPRHQLFLHHHFFPGLHDFERDHSDSKLGQALDLARSKCDGLRVLIDASQLGPQQMGTQVLLVSLIFALSRNSNVSIVYVAVPDPNNLPSYAAFLKSTPKIAFLACGSLDFPNAPPVDIIHRPYQPTEPIPWERWRSISKRCAITIQDLIGYRNGSYFRSWEEWHGYRSNLNRQVMGSDAIFAISHDVVSSIVEEQLSIGSSDIYVVENGVDHISPNQPSAIPESFLQNGWGTKKYALILGATYSHKNRDLGIRIWKELRSRHIDLDLILVGAQVPLGSSRGEEAKILVDREHVLFLPDIPEQERNWLLAECELVIYLTSAEGFGLVPFEAANFGKPCLYVSFGPLREVIGECGGPRKFDFRELVDQAKKMLLNKEEARSWVSHTLAAGASLSWDRCANKTVQAYFEILRRSRR